jgi:hypothetical protein
MFGLAWSFRSETAPGRREASVKREGVTAGFGLAQAEAWSATGLVDVWAVRGVAEPMPTMYADRHHSGGDVCPRERPRLRVEGIDRLVR